jgi:hypothetical protein
MSDDKAQILLGQGVRSYHANMPSFRRDVFNARVGRDRWRVEDVLARAAMLRAHGAKVQFNLVISDSFVQPTVEKFIEIEIEAAYSFSESWDALCLMADDWGKDPVGAQAALSEMVQALPGASLSADTDAGSGASGSAISVELPELTTVVSQGGKFLLVSKCTDWDSADERFLGDVYIRPPGVVMTEFRRGRAFRSGPGVK